MNLHSSVGFVLKRSRHQEEDVRFTLLSRSFGKILLVAKGTQKPTAKLKVLQEPFSEADFQFFLKPHAHVGRLTGGKLINSHLFLRHDVVAFHVAARCAEVIDLLIPSQSPIPEVYDILISSIQSMAKHDPHQVWVTFSVRLFNALGHGELSLAGQSLQRSLAVVESHYERILPRALKTKFIERV